MVSGQVSRDPLFHCVITWRDILLHYKCGFRLKYPLYVRQIRNVAMAKYTSNSNTCMSQNISTF